MERFPVYSLAKTFSAAAVVALGIPLDAPIADLVDVPEPYRRLDLRSILRHRAGLPDYGGWDEYEAAIHTDAVWSLEELLDRAQRHPQGTPGEFRYSNIGYAIVRAALENATGRDYLGALAATVFPALSVDDALPFATPEDWAACVSSATDGTWYHPGWVLTGTFTSTADTLATAYSRLFAGALIDPAHMLEAIPVDVGPHPLDEPGYALGLMVSGRPPRFAGHGGGGPGFTIFALATVDGSAAHVEFVADEVDDAPLIRACLAALPQPL